MISKEQFFHIQDLFNEMRENYYKYFEFGKKANKENEVGKALADFANIWNEYVLSKGIQLEKYIEGKDGRFIEKRKTEDFINVITHTIGLRNYKLVDINYSNFDNELLNRVENLERVLNSITIVKEFREKKSKEKLEKIYKTCKEDIEKITMIDTIKIVYDGKTHVDCIGEKIKYLSMVGYKDSAELQNKFEIKVKKLRNNFSKKLLISCLAIIVISLVSIFCMF